MKNTKICDHKCLACPDYLHCPDLEKARFDLLRLEALKGTVWYSCPYKNLDRFCVHCEKRKQCLTERGLPYRSYQSRNAVLNVFPDRESNELIVYKRSFHYLEDSENLPEIDRGHMLEQNQEGIYEPIREDFTVEALQRSLRNGGKRAMDSFYGYAKSNDWEYFVTLTFDQKIVDRYDDQAVKECYSEFQRWCKRRSPDVRMLMVPERHKKEDGSFRRALHFHGLISNIHFDLELAKDLKTGEYLYTKLGDSLFHIKDWEYGYSTLAILPTDENHARVVNYLQKYINKETNVGYCQKRFYHTRNLNFKNKDILLLDSFGEEDLVEALGLELVKENDKMKVYRKRVEYQDQGESK